MIDFRYHLVSIVAVFLALAIGIVLGSTELQGGTLDALRSTSDSLQNQLNAASAARDSYEQEANAGDTFVQTAEPKLLADMLTGERIVLVTEPGAPSSVISGIQTAAKDAGATITGTIALQPKFNDLSGTNRASLSQLNGTLALADGITLAPATDTQTVYQQDAAQLIAAAILEKTGGQPELSGLDAQTLLKEYENGGYLSVSSGTPTDGASLAVIVTPQATSADGPNDPADEILLAIAAQFARSERRDPRRRPGHEPARVVERDLGAARQQRLQPGVHSGQREHDARPDFHDLGPRRPAARRKAEQLWCFGCLCGQPGCAERDADSTRHADNEGDGKGHEDREHEVKGAARPSLPVIAGTGVVAAVAARAAYTALRRYPPAGEKTWARTNHRGEPVTLLEGPAVTAGAVTGQVITAAVAARLTAGPAVTGGHYPERVRVLTHPLAIAGLGGVAFGVLDDLRGSAKRRGLRGHLGALAHGEVTTGTVKLAGLAVTGLGAALLEGGDPADVVINAGLIAGGANLLNLFDLRPGRAIKVATLSAALIAAAAPSPLLRSQQGAGAAGRCRARRGRGCAAARGSWRAGDARRRGGQRARRDARRGGRPDAAEGRAGLPARRDRRADRGEREGQLHQGHRGHAAAELARHARPAPRAPCRPSPR